MNIRSTFSGKAGRALSVALSALLFFAICAALVVSLSALGGAGRNSSKNNGSAPFIPDEKKDENPIFVREEKKPTVTEDEARAEARRSPNGSVRKIVDTATLRGETFRLPFAGNLSAEGWGTTNLPYDPASMKIAVMTPNFSVTDKFSLRTKVETEYVADQEILYGPFIPTAVEKTVDRPALDTYMGYIVVDEGDILTLYSGAGDRLLQFDDTEYIPAYERDRSGAPLFKRPSSSESVTYDGDQIEIRIYKEDDPKFDDPAEEFARVLLAREPREKDKTVFVDGDLIDKEGQENVKEEEREKVDGYPVREESAAYYRLSYDGSYFAYSDFREFTDSRGPKFDYPAYYGLSDSGLTLSVKLYNLYRKDTNGKVELFHKGYWTYKVWDSPISEDTFERAYNFSEDLGCTLTEPYYLDGGLAFVNRSGNRAFPISTQKKDNTGRIILETFMGPISYGKESIGYFYYDHGLVRVRLESIDGNNYLYDCRVRYLGTKEILIDRSGKRFPIPEGFEVKAYSDGIILLEKDGKYGYMDYTGAWIAEPVYKSALPFSEGLGVLTTAEGKAGVIDANGDIVVPFEYSFISECSDGIMTAYSEGVGWRLLRKMTPS
ncbi:MAG: WG repeat-containing protein [Clostridia bacterium]|nr:WG repeat-containing protein [Clostridia bacterium]